MIHTTPSAPLRTPRERTLPQATPRPPPAAIGPTTPPCPVQTYVQVDGRVYELDGNNDGPLDCGAVGIDGLLKAMVRYVTDHYMAAFPDSHYSIITLGPRPTP